MSYITGEDLKNMPAIVFINKIDCFDEMEYNMEFDKMFTRFKLVDKLVDEEIKLCKFVVTPFVIHLIIMRNDINSSMKDLNKQYLAKYEQSVLGKISMKDYLVK